MPLLLTAAQMRAVDRFVIDELGVPGVVLMENAGRGVVDALVARRPVGQGTRIVVIAGAGQNGGDGFVIARHLANRGARVEVLLAAAKEKIKGDALVYYGALERMGAVSIVDLSTETDARVWDVRCLGAEILVDAIFGTGLRSDVTGVPAAAVVAMNRAAGFRVAVDLPSGLDADSGAVLGVVCAADLTATIGTAKLGLWLDADAPVGDVEIVDLGVNIESLVAGADGRVLALEGPRACLLDDASVAARLAPWGPSGHKGTRGHALVIAGSAGKTGAAVLSGTAAMRAGAGLVTLATTASGQVALDAKVLELMTASYTDGADADGETLAKLRAILPRMKAVAMGPGIPTGPRMAEVVRTLARELTLPLVLDADALNLIGTDAPAVLASARGPRILTPHPGEMGRLVGRPTSEVGRDRLGLARQLAHATGAVVVLKGARTIIASKDGDAFVNPAADASLGTAGSGDVLTGIIVGLLAQGLAPVDAACAGVFVHGNAVGPAKRHTGTRRLVAGDLPVAAAEVLDRLQARAKGAAGDAFDGKVRG